MFEGEDGDMVKNILTDGQWKPNKPYGNKYGIKEPFMPFWEEGDIEGKPTERQNELFNKWCRTKNIDYYDGKDSLKLLYKYAMPRLKRDCPETTVSFCDKGIDWFKGIYPKKASQTLFEDIWFTLRHFYEPKGWQWLVWTWRMA